MYRQVIEHPEWIPREWLKRLNVRAGEDKGRIYRVFPKDRGPRAIPRLDRLDTAGLVAALDSPNGWQRDTVQQLLLQRKDLTAAPLLEKLVRENRRAVCRLHALCTLDGLGALKPEVLKLALADAHPGIRRHAIRLCETQFRTAPELGPAVLVLQSDADPQVQMQLTYSLGEWDDPRAAQALGQLVMANAGERFLVAAALSSVTRKNIDAVLLSLFAEGKKNLPAELTEKLLALAIAQGEPQTLAKLLSRLAAPQGEKFGAWQFAAVAGLLDALDAKNRSLATLANESEGALRPAVHQLGAIFTAARAIVVEAPKDPALLLQPVRLLGRGLDHQDDDADMLAGLLMPQTAETVQKAAVSGLARLKSARVPELLLRKWSSYGPALRSSVLDTLFLREDWLKEVLNALERKQIAAIDIDAARRQRLLEHKTPALRERAALLLAGSIDRDRQKVIESHQAVLKLPGDQTRGREVFGKICAACHQLGGVGHVVGPDLASLADRSSEAMLVAILDPNRAVEARYMNYLATTKNGVTFTGVLASETGNNVTLVGPEGKQQVILRTDLEELISTNKSVMPEGLEKDLTDQNLADVIAFVRAGIPAAARRVVKGNEPRVIRPGPDGSLQLLASNCEIYGGNLIFEKQHSNLSFWRNEDDHAAWSLDVAQPGKYAVWLDYACLGRYAGNSYLLRMGLNQLTGKVKGTNSWDEYRQEQIGEVTLSAGTQQLTLRSAGPIRKYLMDLRGVKLVPVK